MPRPKKWNMTATEQAIHHIETCESLDELRSYWTALGNHLPIVRADDAVIAAKDARKDELSQRDVA